MQIFYFTSFNIFFAINIAVCKRLILFNIGMCIFPNTKHLYSWMTTFRLILLWESNNAKLYHYHAISISSMNIAQVLLWWHRQTFFTYNYPNCFIVFFFLFLRRKKLESYLLHKILPDYILFQIQSNLNRFWEHNLWALLYV